MRLLVDTHTFYWMVDHAENLGEGARSVLEDASNELYLSAATLWEIATKHRIGKFPAGALLIGNLHRLVDKLGLKELPISFEHAITSGSLEWEHRDPFDRMLAAQCVIEDLRLVTRDEVFETLEPVRTIW
ncbi:MAG: type II toxin-antitoxin system VapC family toxin [Coriobacteriales bacterium]|jgi:PIN domain nuclease of toxin-antitoxin system|nr:type II toxin-antitoxin system VapC family toxin [Coriobacteriales bacterium]